MFLLNGRLETLSSTKAFRDLVQSQRCVVPINGYFEWQDGPDRKHPFYINHSEPLFLAALYR